MIQVTLGTNTDRTKILVDPSATPREILEEHDIDYAAGNVRLDSAPIGGSELDKSFEALGVDEKCYLIVVVKANGGY